MKDRGKREGDAESQQVRREETEKAKTLGNSPSDEPGAPSVPRNESFIRHYLSRTLSRDESRTTLSFQSIREEYRSFQQTRQETLRKYMTYEVVVANASPSPEFYVLLILSCLIATFGLYESSPAVIIGAMIVAPLMGPILGFSAGVMWGSGHAIRTSLLTLVKGIAIVLVITAGMTRVIPYVSITSEMLARTSPSLLDVGIAIASGLVGAYAHANNRISAAIPGVAISVALMPPLCTVGIGLGKFDLAVAEGASLLFFINLVGISLAAVIVFYLVRLHPTDAETGEVRQRFVRHVLISAVILAIIIAPLVSFGIQALNTNKDKQVIASSLSEIFGRNDIFSTNIQVDRTTRGYSVRVILLQSPGTDQPKGTALDARLSNALGKTVHSQVLYFNSLQ